MAKYTCTISIKITSAEYYLHDTHGSMLHSCFPYYCEYDCMLLIWLGVMLMKLVLAQAGHRLPVDSFCFSLPTNHIGPNTCDLQSPAGGENLIAWRGLQV